MANNKTEVLTKIQTIKAELNTQFVERWHLIDVMLLALVAKQHVFVMGPPGTAKSATIQALAARIMGATYFQRLLTPYSTPEELFGPPSLKALENDRYERVTAGKLPEAEFAFVDEIFKCNSSMLNSLLTILNERAFDNGTQRLTCPLQSCFGASNELPQDESLQALFDRFILRLSVEYIADGNSWELLMQNAADGKWANAVATTLTKDELAEAQIAAQAVKVDIDAVRTLRVIKAALEAEGIMNSDRRWIQAISILKASAWLAGRDKVIGDDIVKLQDVLWSEPSHQKMVRKLIMKEVAPAFHEALEALDSAMVVFKTFSAKTPHDQIIEISAKLKHNLEELEKLAKLVGGYRVSPTTMEDEPANDNVAKVLQIRQQVMGMYRQVSRRAI